MDSADKQETKRIDRLQRLGNSRRGNPRYLVHFTDGTSAQTMTDGSISYAISNRENQAGDVLVTFNLRGSIIDVQPSHASPQRKKDDR